MKEEPDFRGEPEADNCYGVYFPSQPALRAHEFEPNANPDEAYTIEVTVKRLNSEGEINVPYEMEADELVSADEIIFKDGQLETSFNIVLSSKAEISKTYNCYINIADPQYSLVYSNDYFAGMSLSFTILKWNALKGSAGEKYGYWRDDFITGYMSWPTFDSEEVVIEERADMEGYFRLSNVYTAKYTYKLLEPLGVGGAEADYAAFCDPEAKIIIDATDPEKVIIPLQRIGLDLTELGASDIYIASYTNDYFTDIEPTENLYGSYDEESGMIEFPKNSILMYFLDVWYYANTKGLFRVLMPGFEPIDHSVRYEPGIAEEGKIEIAYSFGTNVREAKYAVYEGSLSASQAKNKAKEIHSDSNAGKLSSNQGIIEIDDLTKTGVYTLVSANYSNLGNVAGGEYADYSYVEFKYVALGDSMPLNLDLELITTDRNSHLGYTSKNSLEIYIKGENITKAYAILVEGDHTSESSEYLVGTYFEPYIENNSLAEFNEELLSLLNGSGYSDLYSGLVPGTEYTLMVYASNGYAMELETVLGKTGGVYDIRYDSFEYDEDLSKSDLKPAKISDLVGTYDYYAYDLLSDRPVERVKVGTVRITSPREGVVFVIGLMGDAVNQTELPSDRLNCIHDAGKKGEAGYIRLTSEPYSSTDDDGNWLPYYYMYDGNLPLPLAPAYVGSYFNMQTVLTMGLVSSADQLLLAGVVEGADGSKAIAFADSYQYASYGYSFSGISLAAYDSNYMNPLMVFSAYDEPLLLPQGSNLDELTRSSAPRERKVRVYTELAGFNKSKQSLKLENISTPNKLR